MLFVCPLSFSVFLLLLPTFSPLEIISSVFILNSFLLCIILFFCFCFRWEIEGKKQLHIYIVFVNLIILLLLMLLFSLQCVCFFFFSTASIVLSSALLGLLDVVVVGCCLGPLLSISLFPFMCVDSLWPLGHFSHRGVAERHFSNQMNSFFLYFLLLFSLVTFFGSWVENYVAKE